MPHQKLFDGNSAHSCGAQWVAGPCIYLGGELTFQSSTSEQLIYRSGRRVMGRDTRDSNWKHAWNEIKNFKTWLANVGVLDWGQRLRLRNFEIHDFLRAATIFGESTVETGLWNAHSSNPRVTAGKSPYKSYSVGYGSMKAFQFVSVASSVNILSSFVAVTCLHRL